MDEYGQRLPLDLGPLAVHCGPDACPGAAVVREALRRSSALLTVTAALNSPQGPPEAAPTAHLEQLRVCLAGVDRAAYRLLLTVDWCFPADTDTGENAAPPAVAAAEAHLREEVDLVLRCLELTFIDVVVLRVPRPDAPVADGVCALQKLVIAGKVRFLGLAGASPASLRRANFVAPIHCIEQEWSLARPDIGADLLHMCRELSLLVVARCPLPSAWLADDSRPCLTDAPDALKEAHGDSAVEAVLQPVVRLRRLAAQLGCSVSQLALAWLWAQAKRHWLEAVVPVVCPVSVADLTASLAARDVALDRAALAEIGAALRDARPTG